MNHKLSHVRAIPVMLLGVLLCVAGMMWPESGYERPLTVAVNVWPGAESLVQACDALNERDRRINLVEMSWSTAIMGAFRKHVVDAAVVTLDELIRLEAEGAKPRAVLVLGVSKGSDAVMGHRDIHSVKSLAGRQIGVELRSAGEYLLMNALDASGMSLKDVNVVPLNLTETESAYHERGIDAVVASDPWCMRLREKGARVLYDSSGMDLDLSRVLVVREEILDTFADDLRALVMACLKRDVTTGLVELPGALDATLRREGLTLEQWQQALRGIHLPDAAENRRLMTEKSGGLEECLERMIRLMRRQGLLQREVSARMLLTPVFLKEKM